MTELEYLLRDELDKYIGEPVTEKIKAQIIKDVQCIMLGLYPEERGRR